MWGKWYGGGGGGFFLAYKIFVVFFENVRWFILRLRFKKRKMDISLRALVPLFRPGSVHSGSASWDDCDWVFPDKYLVFNT